MPFVLKHQTPLQFAARVWKKAQKAHRSGDKPTYGFLVWWIYERVIAGELTNNEARLSFNSTYGRTLTLAQWNTFVTNTIKPIRDRYQATLDEADL